MNTTSCGFISQHIWELPLSLDNTISLSIKDQLKAHAGSLIEKQHITRFLILLESGVPLDAAAAILELRTQYPITLECVIPFEDQHILWSEEERNRYFSILEQCDKEHLHQHHFSLDCYQQSIKDIVAHCSILMVLYNGGSSDAGDAIRYAKKRDRQLLTLSTTQLLNPMLK